MKDQLYKAVEIKDGNSTEPVQYVGVYALNWKREWGVPEWGFVEHDSPQQPSDSAGEGLSWIKKDDKAGKILNKFLEEQNSDSPLFEISLKLLRKLVIAGMDSITRPTVSETEIADIVRYWTGATTEEGQLAAKAIKELTRPTVVIAFEAAPPLQQPSEGEIIKLIENHVFHTAYGPGELMGVTEAAKAIKELLNR